MHSELPAERWVMDRERCRSGRSGRTRNAVYGQLYRGFESLSLRKRPEGRVGCKHSFATFFIFGAGRIYPERSENESWAYGAQAKIRSSQGRLRSDGGKDGRHAVTRSPARSAEEWKRGEMLYGSTAFLCLQRGKVVRMDCGDREWLIRFLFRDICNLRPDRGKWRAKFLPHSSPSSNGTQKGFKGVYISFKIIC